MKIKNLKSQLVKQTLGLIVLIFALVSIITSLMYYQNSKKSFLDKNNRLLSMMNQQVQHFLTHPEEELQWVEEALVKNSSKEEMQNEVVFILQKFDYIYRIEHIDKDGMIIGTYPERKDMIGLDYSRHPVFTNSQSKSEDAFVFGGTFVDPVKGYSSVSITMKGHDGSHIVGYISLDKLQDTFAILEAYEITYAVLDEDGYYLLNPNKDQVTQRVLNPHYVDHQNGFVKNGDLVIYNQKRNLVQFQEIPETGWAILIYQDIQSVVTPLLMNLSFIIFAFFIFGFGALFSINLMLAKMEQELQSFIQMTRNVSEGDYKVKESNQSYSEFVDLKDNFRKMIDKVEVREERIYELNRELEESYLNTVFLLAKTIEAKDAYTGDHCDRVNRYALMIGKKIGLDEKMLKELSHGSILHDIGKLNISESILAKPGRLSEAEYAIVKKHSAYGYELVKAIPGMEKAKEIVYYHHERFDGKGYPKGLVGEEIPLMARIVCIADAFDAMTSKRIYRDRTFTQEEAIQDLKRNRNLQFDGELVDIFITCLKSEN
ncbi:hypothetical protein SANA_03850 [Gottschalkiaceae bacterium SANA]|nr:hypothetical protein SANA_03850 [Gottschalkiaceae bacterium SANA]